LRPERFPWDRGWRCWASACRPRLAAIGAAIALGPIGSASLAVIAEKPEMFGRTLIYMGLAEGIAIYGLVMSILLLGKL
jgi:V/A-type H+-transporting ATPase subunit K